MHGMLPLTKDTALKRTELLERVPAQGAQLWNGEIEIL